MLNKRTYELLKMASYCGGLEQSELTKAEKKACNALIEQGLISETASKQPSEKGDYAIKMFNYKRERRAQKQDKYLKGFIFLLLGCLLGHLINVLFIL